MPRHTVQHGDGLLQNDWPGVGPFVHEVHRHARHLHSCVQHGLMDMLPIETATAEAGISDGWTLIA